ncbi:MAG: hypothetical protein M0Z80_10900 [Treponema sp.]|nr:hypothetical protein [Treponema sp.]
MSMEAADLKKLVKIVRQYEVIYGGGISTSDAAVREECESLVTRLETELGTAPRGKRGSKVEESLPSLVDMKKAKREEKPVRPLRSRARELAGLAAPARPDAADAAGKRDAAAKAAEAAARKGKSAAAEPPKKPATGGRTAATERAAGAKPAPAAKAGGAAKAGSAAKAGGAAAQDAERRSSRAGEDVELLSRLRSSGKGAAKAAADRADRLAGPARSAEEVAGDEPRKRFAAQHLFDAFKQSKLPKYGGFIVCVRFAGELGYAVFEIIGYENLQDIYPEGDTLVFKTVGCKLYAFLEPPSFLLKSVEPVNRPSEQMVPYRFSELLHLTSKRLQNIYVGRKPVFMPTSFSVFRPEGDDLAVLFYDIADVYSNIQDFIIMILRDRLSVPAADARKAGEVVARGIREFRLWLDEA